MNKKQNMIRFIYKDGYVRYLDENGNPIRNTISCCIDKSGLSKKTIRKLNLYMYGCDIKIPKKNIMFEFNDNNG